MKTTSSHSINFIYQVHYVDNFFFLKVIKYTVHVIRNFVYLPMSILYLAITTSKHQISEKKGEKCKKMFGKQALNVGNFFLEGG